MKTDFDEQCKQLNEPKLLSQTTCYTFRRKMIGTSSPYIIIIIIMIGFSVYLHNSPGDITQFNNKSMQKTEKF